MAVDGLPFSVTFTPVPDEGMYSLLLDRVWFWDVAKRTNASRALLQTAPKTAQAQLRSVTLKEGVLY